MSRLAEIKRYVIAEFARDVHPDDLAVDFDLLENGVVDSLGLVRLIAWIGEKYDIPVDDMNLSPANFRTVRAITEFAEGSVPVPARGKLS